MNAPEYIFNEVRALEKIKQNYKSHNEVSEVRQMCDSMRTNPHTPEHSIVHNFTYEKFDAELISDLLKKMSKNCYVILRSDKGDFSQASKGEVYGTKFITEPFEHQILLTNLEAKWPPENDYITDRLPTNSVQKDDFFVDQDQNLIGHSIVYELPMVDIKIEFNSTFYRTSLKSVVFYDLLAFCLDEALQA